jgi:predicted enzyme related to lactoylglutathione lyase
MSSVQPDPVGEPELPGGAKAAGPSAAQGEPGVDATKALRYYTDVLGFQKKTEVPVGEHRWLTVVSPEAADGTERLRARGVTFTQEPLTMGPVTTAVFDDTCGNLIQIAGQQTG